MNPFTPVERRGAEARARRILEALRTEDVLSDEAYELAIDQIGRLRIPRRGSRPAAALHAVLRLSERVRKDKVHSQILHTTLDLDLQEEVTWAAWEELYKWQPRGAQNGAVIVVDRASNEVLAFMGSTDYFDEERAGAIDYTAVARSSGSTLKRFLYGLALEMGAVTPATILDDLPRGSSAITNADKLYLGPHAPPNRARKLAEHTRRRRLGDGGYRRGIRFSR